MNRGDAIKAYKAVVRVGLGPQEGYGRQFEHSGLNCAHLVLGPRCLGFYLFAATFGLGFGAEWTRYLEINRRYFGDGAMGSIYGWQMTGAFAGHANTTFLAGLVIYVTGSFYPVFVLSGAFSAVGLLVIASLESTAEVLIPDWEDSLPAEARSNFVTGAAAGDD